MKKLFFVTFCVAIAAISASAQIYAGGSVGIDFGANNGQSSKGPSYSSLFLSPMAGYYMSDKLSVGAELTLGIGSSNSRGEGNKHIKRSTIWGFAPFARYTLLEAGKLAILGECRLGLNGASTKSGYSGELNKGASIFEFGIYAMPVLTFGITNKLSLEARTGLARFGFGISTTKYSSSSKATDTFFGIGINSSRLNDEVLGMVGGSSSLKTPPFEIGVTYKIK
ncbi:MAG: hypothetical protein LBC84_00850 [Prevotellaceae bacterium]|jgi:hypothetical protein|nr:hypothetical protein [Prevotellaceae bacterium]